MAPSVLPHRHNDQARAVAHEGLPSTTVDRRCARLRSPTPTPRERDNFVREAGWTRPGNATYGAQPTPCCSPWPGRCTATAVLARRPDLLVLADTAGGSPQCGPSSSDRPQCLPVRSPIAIRPRRDLREGEATDLATSTVRDPRGAGSTYGAGRARGDAVGRVAQPVDGQMVVSLRDDRATRIARRSRSIASMTRWGSSAELGPAVVRRLRARGLASGVLRCTENRTPSTSRLLSRKLRVFDASARAGAVSAGPRRQSNRSAAGRAAGTEFATYPSLSDRVTDCAASTGLQSPAHGHSACHLDVG